MNANVEVATAQVATQTVKVVVSSYRTLAAFFIKVMTTVVVTSTLRVLSLGGHSLSAVAPDNYTNFGGTAEAA